MGTEIENLPKTVSNKARKTILDSFRLLSANDNDKRRKNALHLLKHVCNISTEKNQNGEIQYTLNRLIRGLGSSTNSSRSGFFSVLVALLSTSQVINVDEVLTSIKKELNITNSNSKGENGEIYLGQILAGGALVHSNVFLKASEEQKKAILDLLLNGRSERRYLALAASTFIIDLINLIDKKDFDTIVWPKLLIETVKPWEEQTLDNIYIILTAENKFPGISKIAKVCTCFGKNGIVSKSNVAHLCDMLFKHVDVASLKHPANTLLSQEIAKSPGTLQAFLAKMDAQIAKQNRNKLLVASIIIRNILSSIKVYKLIPEVLTNVFVQNMLSYYESYESKSDKEFQTEQKKLFEALFKCLQNEEIDANVKVAVISKLLFTPGTLMFEKVTRSKIIQQLVQTLDAEAVKMLSKLFKGVIVGDKNGKYKTCAAHLLVKMLNHPKVQTELEWKVEYMKFMIDLSIVKSEQKTQISGLFRDMFFKTLDQKVMKLEDCSSLLSSLVQHLQPAIVKADPASFLVPLKEDDFKVLKQMYKITSQLTSNEKTDNFSCVFRILFFHMSLQVFKNRDLALSSLEELFMCYKRIKTKTTEGEQDEPQWIEVVVDLFLNLLSHNSRLFRNVIDYVFPHLCVYLTPSSIQQILSAFDPQSESNPLSNIEEESDDDEEETIETKEESDEESDFETEEHETVTDKLRLAVQQALSKDDCKTDDESVDLDEMSETEGDRLNDALAVAFKQFTNKGVNKKQSEEDLVLMNFRIRALDLIERYLNHRPSLLSCLEIMPSLLNTLEFTIPNSNQEPLQLRVRACLKKLTQIKKFANESIDAQTLANLLKEITDKKDRSVMIYQYMMKDITDCCIFIIRNSQTLYITNKLAPPSSVEDDPVIQVVHDLTSKFIEERSFVLPYSILSQTFPFYWYGNLFLVAALFHAIFDSKSTKQKQIVTLLKTFYANRRSQYEQELFKLHLSKRETKFCRKFNKKLDAFCENPSDENKINETTLSSLLALLKLLATYPLKNENIKWNKLAEKLREFRSRVTFTKSTQGQFNELCAALKVSNVVEMKAQTTELTSCDNGEGDKISEVGANKKKLKFKDQQALKMKKEARQLRLESMSKGLTDEVSFASLKEEREMKPKKEVKSESEDDLSIKDESDDEVESEDETIKEESDDEGGSEDDLSIKEESDNLESNDQDSDVDSNLSIKDESENGVDMDSEESEVEIQVNKKSLKRKSQELNSKNSKPQKKKKN